MIVGLGVDIVELDRIQHSVNRFGERFMNRILTEYEKTEMPRKGTASANFAAFMSARFAAKEAAVKALGTGFTRGIGFRDVEVRSLPSGKPTITLYNNALSISKELQVTSIHVSLTHGRDAAVAVVVMES